MAQLNAAVQKSKLEDYRQGYPRLAAFLNLDKNFTIIKRFDYLHMRTLLEQQDQLAELQDSLNHYDDTETVQIGLTSRRQDSNQGRRALLEQIRVKLETYDRAVQGYHSMLCLPEATERQRHSVENWFVGNKPLVRSESSCFLECLADKDFVALVQEESDRAGLETLVETAAKLFPGIAKHFATSGEKTQDSHIFIFAPHLLSRIVKAFLAFFIPLWLVFPTILLHNAPNNSIRAIIYTVFTFATSLIVIILTNTTKYDLMLALITYTTLLSAFLAETTSGDS